MGLLEKLWRSKLKSKLKKDKDFQDALNDYDEKASDLAKKIEKMEKLGVEVPDELKKLANIK
ncbi:MAG: hypothetical protein RI573_04390 [Balneolaceae bacterium]|nr:hypothetical protein [Balneolaceae bacterium]